MNQSDYRWFRSSHELGGDSFVSMMEFPKDPYGNDFPFHLVVIVCFSRNGTFSFKALVQPEILVPCHILTEKVSEMLFMEDDDMIKELST